ncbi:metallophosphoesterase family protein [Labrenzia sp. 011]|uniref:metallophosphoesterase family protein n=1 Tax=Labrenzia sp. 011 TaxID=2171494 RepID=UPI00140221D0|nr:metallophosphoesterase family protein [Labrenzia sp. 011]
MTEDRIVYAIGDIHGMAGLLRNLLERIEAHAIQRQAVPQLVFLGDLVDRGHENVAVLDTVCDCLDRYEGSRLILGNHDEYFLKFLDGTLDAESRGNWHTYGGLETLRSYGVDPDDDEKTAAARVRERYPHHYRLLLEAVPCVDLDRFFLVHAGVRPGVPLNAQAPQDLRWIREPFLSSEASFGKTVVHGHTITKSGRPEVFPNRVAIDTGAYASGHLTAAVLPSPTAEAAADRDIAFLST